MNEYLPILIFLIFAFALSFGAFFFQFLLEKDQLIQKKTQLMNVVLNHLTTLEEDLR